MAENLPADVVPDEPLPEGVVADAPLPQDVVPDEPEIPNLGVLPAPSRAAHRAALEAPPTALATAPGARTLGGPEFAAFQATHSGVNGDQAAQALRLAKRTGFAPEMVAQNADAIQQRVDQTGFEDGLGAAPVVAEYAARGPMQASLVKEDIAALSALNAGFLDVGRQYMARKYMAMEPGMERDVLRGQIGNVERLLGHYEEGKPGIVAQTVRMLPTVASYITAGIGGALAAGPAAPGGALAAPFWLNYEAHVGELYMRLQDAEESRAAADPAYVRQSDKEIREYAKKGAIFSSTWLTAAGQPFLRGLPYATAALEKVGLGIVAKAGEDSVVRAAVSRLLELGAHTLSGATTMAGMAVGDDATVQKATTGKIDVGQATKAGTKAFVDALGPTAALSALVPVKNFFSDIGRIRDARVEAVDLAAKVEQAKASKLIRRAPEEAEKVFRIMADGSGSETIYVAEFDKLPFQIAQAVARAAGPHALGDDRVTGGGVAVPIGKYLTQLTDHHESIKDNVRLSEDGLTPKEAAEWQEAWHGTPHDFEKFQLAHVGTGEGGQAYGHGIYFAERRSVAEQYQENLRPQPKPLLDVPEVQRLLTERLRAKAAETGDVKTAAAAEHMSKIDLAGDFADSVGKTVSNYGKDYGVKVDDLVQEQPSHVHRAAIPHKDLLLDYDKPLSEHPPEIRRILRQDFSFGDDKATGADVYHRIVQDYNDNETAATEAMRRSGIPGLKYLDAGSRKIAPLFDGKPIDDVAGLRGIDAEAFDAIAQGFRHPNVRTVEDAVDVAVKHGDFQTPEPWQRAVREMGARFSLQKPEATHNFVIWDESKIHKLQEGENQLGIGKPDTLGALMAAKDWIIRTEPDTPERTAKIASLVDRMRGAASRGVGGERPGLGRPATEEEVAAEMKKLETAVPPGEEPTLAQTSPYQVPKPPKVTADDHAAAREHIEGKTIGEIRPSYYENAGRKAGERALKLATGPDLVGEKIREKYAEALGVSLDTVRNAVQGTFSVDTLAEVRRKVRGAETEANRLEAGRMETLTKLEGQHAMNVANRQADIQAAVQQQKNAKVFAEVAHDVRNEMDRTEQKLLSKAGDSDFLGKLSMAGPEYRDAHDALFAAMFSGPEPSPQRGALEPLLARMENEAQPIAFDVDAIRALLADPKEWKDLTPPEARNLADAVANIRETAQRMNQIARADRLQSKADFIAAVRDETAGRKDIGAPRLTRSVASLGERVMRQAGAYNAANLKPETIFSMLGETAQGFFEDGVIGARNRKAALQGEILRYFQDNFDKQMREKAKELARPVETDLTVPKEVDLDGSRMNQETLAMAFLNLGTFSNEQRLLGGYGWEKQSVLDAIGKHLKPEMVRMLQGILSYHDDKLWPLIREKAAKSGVTPPKIPAQPITITFADGTTETFAGGYFPAAPHPDALNIPSREGDGIQNLDRFAQATVRAAFTKERVEGAEYPVDLNWSRYPAHLESVLHYLAYDEPVRDMGRLLRDDEFRQIVRHRVGPEYLKQLDDDLRIWARGNADGMRTISLPSRMVSRVLRTRAVSNALAFSTPIALGQESHIQYAITSGQISLKNGTVAMGRALVPETWQAANETFSELRFRSDHYAKQFREALLTGSAAKSEIMRGVDIAAFAQMDMADRLLSHVITDAAYNDAIDQGMEHPDAVTYANRKLRLLMPTHNVLEMAPIVRDRGTIGALMLFRGLPNVVWNVEAGLYDEAHQQMAAAVGPRAIAAAGGRAALNGARAVASLAVLHMLGRLLMGHGKKEEDGPGLEGWGTWAARESISSQFSRIPLGRDIMEPIVDGIFHDKAIPQIVRDMQSGQHLAPDVAIIVGMLRDLGTMADEGKETPDRIQAGLNTFASTLGVGIRPITRAARYGFDVFQGNRSPRGPFDVAGGLVYGERDRQDKNPGTAIQDVISGE